MCVGVCREDGVRMGMWGGVGWAGVGGGAGVVFGGANNV